MIYLPGDALRERVVGHFARMDADYAAREEGCQFCGHSPTCEMCGRCFDPYCNAGCLFCRNSPPPRTTCPCCGQEVHT